MRSCDEILELISAALDDDLSAEEQAALEEHLSNCPTCSALFTELSGLHSAAAQLEEIPAPAGFAGQVMNRIHADPMQELPDNTVPFSAKKRSRTPWRGWAATAAVVAVVILGATALNGRNNMASKNDNASSGTAPASAETVTATTSADDSSASFFMYTQDENGADGGEFRNSTEYAEPESALSPQSAEKASGAEIQMQDMCDAAADSDSPSPAAYCGVLTLTGEPLPEGLEDYEGLTDSTGAVTYVVPSDCFFSFLAQLEGQDAANFTYDDSGEETAGYGLIVVEAP